LYKNIDFSTLFFNPYRPVYQHQGSLSEPSDGSEIGVFSLVLAILNAMQRLFSNVKRAFANKQVIIQLSTAYSCPLFIKLHPNWIAVYIFLVGIANCSASTSQTGFVQSKFLP
ncbi:hypothetical protein RRG08_063856, partial [Elysia crispata]